MCNAKIAAGQEAYMPRLTRYINLTVILSFLGSAIPALSQQNSVTGSEMTGYHMRVVSRSTQSVDYRHKGSTSVDIEGTDLAPQMRGEAKIAGESGGVKIEASVEHVPAANSFGLAYLTYVLWAITPEGQPKNLGEMILKDGKSSVRTTTDFQAFALIVTAEPDFAVAQPSDLVVAQNVIRPDTKGGIEPVDVKFELISRDVYNSQVTPIEPGVYDPSKKTPLDLLEARNALRIAKDSQASQYAADELQKAQDLLNQAEAYYHGRKGSGPIGTVAREATQTAEEARLMSIKGAQDAAVAAQRQADADRAAQAQADAQAQQAAAAQAQAQAAQAQEAQQQADAARQQAEQARQQAENEKSEVRARLLGQLNQVLATKDTAKGLIVNMPDVLFQTGKADLAGETREQLAKIAGILIAYPDIKVAIDGYTDSTGSLQFNEQLSQQRADAVRSYLASQGVNSGSITSQGFGPSDPVASNDTASGRQQNRRVELVLNGSSIDQTEGQNGSNPNSSATTSNSAQ
jgi:outer membrane protein OmpA-like peptidoglycan-associated protein